MSLRDALRTPDEKRRYVRRLFDTIAPRYDLITVLLSYGQDRRWKRRLVALAHVTPGEDVLDLACGTGDLAFESAACGARVTALDVTARMIALARSRSRAMRARPSPRFLVGDMMALPFSDARFSVVTAGYGLRNVPRLEPALAEILRVLRPGGRFLSLDFNRPRNPVVRGVYLTYLTIVGSAWGLLLHHDPDTYRYIPESIRRYPGAAGVAQAMRRSGFATAEAIPVFGGLMTIHRAVKA